jgi:hypothetical protein
VVNSDTVRVVRAEQVVEETVAPITKVPSTV